MIGDKELLYARIDDVAVTGVWIHVLDAAPDPYTVRDAVESVQNSTRAQILVLPTEPIAALDMTPLRGLLTIVIGENQRRCLAVATQCKKHAARTVVLDGEHILDTGAVQ